MRERGGEGVKRERRREVKRGRKVKRGREGEPGKLMVVSAFQFTNKPTGTTP